MNFNEWIASVPKEVTGDSLWKMEAYRLALFVTEIGWHDVTELTKDKRTVGVADQLYRALGSVSANLAESYSHYTGKSHHILKQEVVNHRISFLTQIIKLLLVMVPQQRGKTLTLHEEKANYNTEPKDMLEQIPFS